jgi:hypothetical protein
VNPSRAVVALKDEEAVSAFPMELPDRIALPIVPIAINGFFTLHVKVEVMS